MKREIKFRGRRIDNGEWVYGYLVVDPKGQCKIYWQPFQAATGNTYHIIDPETVGQYTGLKDKNGVEIYEWDIILSRDGYAPLRNRTVIFDSGSFMLHDKALNAANYVLWYFRPDQIEVIGNVFENPELL